MSEHAGEKTEQASPKRQEEAVKKGQFARSPEVQTLFVIMFGVMGMKFAGPELWRTLTGAQFAILGHLHETPLSSNMLQGYSIAGALALMLVIGGTSLVVDMLTLNCMRSVLRSCARMIPFGFVSVCMLM